MNQTKIKFPAEVARVALELGVGIRDKIGTKSILRGFRGEWGPYALASDKPLTPSQAQALGEAWPGSVWTDGKTLHRFKGGTWNARHPGDSHWHEAGEMGWGFAPPADPLNEPDWHLVSGPEEETEPRPQGATLLDCMRYAKDNGVQVRVRRQTARLWFCTADRRGRLISDPRSIHLEDLEGAKPCEASVDDGQTWFNPLDPSQIKPRTGADLRRWLVENPGRKAENTAGDLIRWNEAESAFEKWYCGAWSPCQPRTAEYIPADGKDW